MFEQNVMCISSISLIPDSHIVYRLFSSVTRQPKITQHANSGTQINVIMLIFISYRTRQSQIRFLKG